MGKGTVHNLISDYNRFGPEVVEGVGRGGRRNAHLTREEEAEFIAPFVDMAEEGQSVRGAQIGKILEERVRCLLHHSIIYRLLDRHGWRTDMMNIFLEEVSREFSEFLVIMQVDQAGWHKSKGLRIPENIRLLPQPPHSPELNPVEHLWEELREKACPNPASVAS